MATFIAKQFAVERLVAISGANSFVGQWPSDDDRNRGRVATPAPWIRERGKTSPQRLYSFGDLHGRVCTLWAPAQVAQDLPGVARQVEKLPGGSVARGSPPPLASMMVGLHKLCASTCWHNRTIETMASEHLGGSSPPRPTVDVSDHSAAAMDCCTPLVKHMSGGWEPLYAPVWEHMLTDEPAADSYAQSVLIAEQHSGEVLTRTFGDCGCLSYP